MADLMAPGAERMRVLVFVPWYLPGRSGGGMVQSCANLVDHLGDAIDFSVVSRDTDRGSKEPYAAVRRDSWNELPDGTRVYYFSRARLKRFAVKAILASEPHDAVYLNGLFSYHFTLLPLRLLHAKPSERVIVAVRGMLAPSALAISGVKKRLFLQLAKRWRLFDAVVFHATNEEEAGQVREVFGLAADVRVAPNLPRKHVLTGHSPPTKHRGSLRLVSIARIAPEKNTLFALEVLQRVQSKVDIDFYGPVSDKAYWVSCQKAVQEVPERVRARFRGPLSSENVASTLSQYHAFFLPTRGENFGHAILEAMQSGLPVIISDQTPWRDLEDRKIGWTAPLDDPAGFAEIIEACAAMDEDTFRPWSASAGAYAAGYTASEDAVEANRRLLLELGCPNTTSAEQL